MGAKKRITLVRHAKSSWDYEVSDRDRPLMDRGIADAHSMANFLRGKLTEPDLICSSPANRALHTCIIYCRNLGFNLNKLQISDAMYDFSGSSVRQLIHGLDPNYDHVMLFGHNEAFTALANELGNEYIANVPTAACVHLSFQDADWGEIGRGQTEFFVFPKQLK